MTLADSEKHRMPGWLRRMLRLFAFPLACYLGMVLLFAGFQRSLIYPARQTPPLRAAEHGTTGYVIEDQTVLTEDGLQLHGWHIQPGDATTIGQTTIGREAPLIVHFHGNGGNRVHRQAEARLLTELGATVLLFDYRGYAENPGTPSERGLRADSRAVWNLALTLAGSRRRIVLYGDSLGGAVAVALAAELSEAGTPPAGLVLVSTFDDLASAARTHYSWLPIRLALLDRWDSRSAIRRVTCPLLMLHGEEDSSVPITLGERLFTAAPENSSGGIPKRFVSLPGANHNDLQMVSREPLRTALAEFLKTILP